MTTKGPFDPARYAEWRQGVPFTDEQIAAALDAEADNYTERGNTHYASRYHAHAARVRTTGRVSSLDLRTALPRLITVCNLCGKTALYRTSCEGRCKAHRMVPSQYVARMRARLDQGSEVITAEANARDRRLRTGDAIRKTRKLKHRK